MRICKVIMISVLASFLFSIAGSSKKLPAMMLKTVDGKWMDVSQIENDGKPVMISFFALWCKPCLRELSAIAEVYEEWQKETGVKLIAVSIDDARSTDKVRSEVNAREYPWEVLLDPNADFKRAIQVNTIPHVLLLDKEGEIVWQHTSYVDGMEEEIIQQVRNLLKKESDDL